jgi:general secretion pathway protein F
MATFNYTAMDQQGRNTKGVLEGDSPKNIRSLLRQQGLIPLSVDYIDNHQSTSVIGSQGSSWRMKKFSVTDLALFTRQLSSLVSSSMPVEEALSAVAEQNDKPHIKRIILGVREKILEGHSLAASLDAYPRIFPGFYRASVSAGENSGHLDVILNELADYSERQQEISQQVQQALIYPAVMSFVAVSIIIFLLTYIVPSMVGVFQESGHDLPGLTRILLSISNAVMSYGLYTIVLTLLAIWVYKRRLRYIETRNRYHRFLLKLPLLGNSLKIINTARFMHTFGLLCAAGVEVIQACHIATKLVNLVPIYRGLLTASQRIQEGTPINQALRETGYFSPMCTHLIANGEKSGQLPSMLQRAADNQQREVNFLLSSSLKLFEPLMILLMGGVVLFIVLAILLPIFEMNQLVTN